MAKWRSFRCTDADAESAEPVPGPRPGPDAAPGACALRAACELDGCTASAFCTTRSRRALCWKLKCIRTGTGTRIRIRIHIHTHTHSQSQSQSHLAFTNLRLLPVPISPPCPSPLPYISCFVESMSKVRNMQFAASTRQKEVQNERSMLFMSM